MIDGFTRVLCYGDKTLIDSNLDGSYIAPNLIKPQPKCCSYNNITGMCEPITSDSSVKCNRSGMNKNPGQNPTWVHRCCQDLGNIDEVGDLACNKIKEPNCERETGHPCCQQPPSLNCYNDADVCCECRCSSEGNCSDAPIICSNMDIVGRDIPCSGCDVCCSYNDNPTYHGDLFTGSCCRNRLNTCDEDSDCCNTTTNTALNYTSNNGCMSDDGNTNCISKNRKDLKRDEINVGHYRMKKVSIFGNCVLVRCGSGNKQDPCVKYRGC